MTRLLLRNYLPERLCVRHYGNFYTAVYCRYAQLFITLAICNKRPICGRAFSHFRLFFGRTGVMSAHFPMTFCQRTHVLGRGGRPFIATVFICLRRTLAVRPNYLVTYFVCHFYLNGGRHANSRSI